MRSVVNLAAAIVVDVATQQPVTGLFTATQDDANQAAIDLGAIYTPPNFEIPVRNYYIELNKNTLIQFMNMALPNGLLNLSYVSETNPAGDWNSNNAAFQTSRRVDGDEPHFPPPGETETKIVPPETLLAALENFAALMIRQGFKNTPGSLLAQLIGFITLLQKNGTLTPSQDQKLNVLLTSIVAAIG